MFSYYGSKSKIIKKYPVPKYNTIIEPFAGSARYALLYPDRQIILNDKYTIISNIWDYIINATQKQIEALPELNKGDDIRKLDITEVERHLMGFMVNMGFHRPANIYTGWAAKTKEITRCKKRIISYLDKIRHWKVTCMGYKNLKNIKATWYVDPPYRNGGHLYVENKIDYKHLAKWCKSRKGQVIVCENGNANWLDFKPLVMNSGSVRKTMELIWTK